MRDNLGKFAKGHEQFNSGKTHFKKGYTPWNKGKKCPTISQSLIGRKLTEEHKTKIIQSLYGRKMSEYTKRKLREAPNKRMLGKRHTIETKEKIRLSKLGDKNPMFGKHSWNKGISPSPVTLRKILSKSHRSPNGTELVLNQLLKTNFPHEWKFVGNGRVVIEGKNPDFININGKKLIIDLFGKHWHDEDEIEPRINLFAKYGYKTLILWDYELKDEKNAIERIKNL